MFDLTRRGLQFAFAAVFWSFVSGCMWAGILWWVFA